MKSELLNEIPNIQAEFYDERIHKSSPHDLNLKLFNAFKNQSPSFKQVHGIDIGDVTDVNKICGNVDGLFTETTIPIGIITADCLPLLCAKKDGKKIAALHAGWRGLQGGILENFKNFLTVRKESLKDWVVAIGPSIQSCCYEVDETLIEQFHLKFPSQSLKEISPDYRKLNLSKIAENECLKLGFSKVDRLNTCTHCHKDKEGLFLYPSYRREKTTKRSHSLIQKLT